MKKLLFAFSLLLAPSITSAQEPSAYLTSGAELGLINFSTLAMDDQVTDGCWTNSANIMSIVKLAFERSDLPVLDYQPAFFSTNIVSTELEALGFRNGNGTCAVHATFRVETLVRTRIGGEGYPVYAVSYVAQVFKDSAIFTTNANSNNQLKDFFEGASSEFLARVLSSRRDEQVRALKLNYPGYERKPPSAQEWQEMREEALQE